MAAAGEFGLALLAAVLVSPLAAQTKVDSSSAPNSIRAVLIEPTDVFPDSEARALIPRLANALHITTRPAIIRRELLLRVGESYDSARAAETERNLRGLRVFRSATVDSARTDSGLVLRVRTQDAFSTRIEGSIEGSSQSTEWWVAVNELNLLGTATRVGARYRHNVDRDAVTTSFQRNRLFDNRIGVTALYDARSDGRMLYGVVALPFLSFSARHSWYLSGEERKERILRFTGGNATASQTLERRFWMARGGVSWAPDARPGGYFHVNLEGQVRRDDYSAEDRTDTLSHTVSGALTGYLEWRRARFLVSRDFQGFGRAEDVDLGTTIRAGIGLTPKAFGYRDEGVVPNVMVRSGLGWRGGFAIVAAQALARIRETGFVDSGSVHLGATVVLKPTRRQMTVLHASHGWLKDPMPGAEFDLGIGLGPRGYPRHAFTGDRAFLLTTEYRYLLTDNFLRSAGLGLAAFADYGGAWYRGSPRRAGYSVGVGIRFGLTLTTDLVPARLDLVYAGGAAPLRGGWRLAFGKGFVFSTTGRLDR